MKTDLQVLRSRLRRPTSAVITAAVSYYDHAHISELAPEQAAAVAAGLRNCIDTLTVEAQVFEARAQEVQ